MSADCDRFVERHRSACDSHGKILPLDEFHHQRAILDAVDVCDIRMVQRGQRLRFALEPRHAVGICCEQLRQGFDCDVSVQPCIARAIDLPFPPAPIELMI